MASSVRRFIIHAATCWIAPLRNLSVSNISTLVHIEINGACHLSVIAVDIRRTLLIPKWVSTRAMGTTLPKRQCCRLVERHRTSMKR